MNSLKNKVSNELTSHGYTVVAFSDTTSFKDFCSTLGKVTQYADVMIQPGKKEYKWIPDAIPFHTDNPTSHTIGFYCIEQDGESGANLLLDVRPILASMTRHDIALLKRAKLKMPNSDNFHPVYSATPVPHIFYLPYFWQMAAATENSAIGDAMRRFHSLVLAVDASGNYVSVKLSPGQALFIDNRFILHARGAIAPESKRYLIRSLITSFN